MKMETTSQSLVYFEAPSGRCVCVVAEAIVPVWKRCWDIDVGRGCPAHMWGVLAPLTRIWPIHDCRWASEGPNWLETRFEFAFMFELALTVPPPLVPCRIPVFIPAVTLVTGPSPRIKLLGPGKIVAWLDADVFRVCIESVQKHVLRSIYSSILCPNEGNSIDF
jgi:hypothetical protein